MKIAYCSDLHLEFGPLSLENTENADLLLLGGDILVAIHYKMFFSNVMASQVEARVREYDLFFKEISERFPQTLIIAGNHEHYHGDYNDTLTVLRKAVEPYPNIKYMDCEVYDVGDAKIIGATLWTNMDNHNPIKMVEITRCMTDFNIIQDGDLKFTAEKSAEVHQREFDFIQHTVREDRKTKFIVMSHHAPSEYSSSAIFKGSVINPAFYSNLESYITEQPNIPFWIHGHMHNRSDYMLGKTNVLCNPRGYAYHEQRASDFELEYFEV